MFYVHMSAASQWDIAVVNDGPNILCNTCFHEGAGANSNAVGGLLVSRVIMGRVHSLIRCPTLIGRTNTDLVYGDQTDALACDLTLTSCALHATKLTLPDHFNIAGQLVPCDI